MAVLSAPRWTHVALPVGDLAASIEWYQSWTPLRLLDHRTDEVAAAAWLGHPEAAEHPFILVLVESRSSPRVAQPTLGPFAHLGIELTSHADVDHTAERARAAGCLAWEPQQLPPPIGYVCAAHDPDGNVVEFSFEQGVYDKARALWG